VLLGAWPVIIANAVTLALAATILGLKLKYGGRPPA
jgi:MtN3 and saliva related transmembrane protein